MYINAVTSNFGAWRMLNNEFSYCLEEVNRVLFELDDLLYYQENNHYVHYDVDGKKFIPDFHPINYAINKLFLSKGWKPEVINLPSAPLFVNFKEERIVRSLDLLKDRIGIVLFIGLAELIESKLFSDLPFFYRSGKIDFLISLIPLEIVTNGRDFKNSGFETITHRLLLLEPTFLRYPFVIIGYSESETDLKVIELTSELDQFLISKVGLSINEMITRNEMINYDFKIILPSNDKVAKEICAMANCKGGGILLIGIDKAGNVQGISKGNELDEIQLKVSNVIHDNLSPRPDFTLRMFDLPGESQKCLLILDINEIEQKPCMTGERVYIRSGTSAVAAGPDEIRRLVIGN